MGDRLGDSYHVAKVAQDLHGVALSSTSFRSDATSEPLTTAKHAAKTAANDMQYALELYHLRPETVVGCTHSDWTVQIGPETANIVDSDSPATSPLSMALAEEERRVRNAVSSRG